MKSSVFWTVGAVAAGLAAAGAIGFAAGKSGVMTHGKGRNHTGKNSKNTNGNAEENEEFIGMPESGRDVMADVVERESGMMGSAEG